MKKEWFDFIDNLDEFEVPSFLELLMENKEFVLLKYFTLNDLCLKLIEKLDEEYRADAFSEFTFETLINYSSLSEDELREKIDYFGTIKLLNNDISGFDKAIGFNYKNYIKDLKRDKRLNFFLDEK